MQKLATGHRYDVIIIGAGGAGLSAALFLSDLLPNIKIAIVCKTYAMGSHTTSAKGGINAALGNVIKDDYTWHIYDTKAAGKGLCDSAPTEQMCKEAPSVIEFLAKNGVKFDLTSTGLIDQRIYGGQTTECGNGELAKRACFVKDHTGHAIMEVLWNKVLGLINIDVLEYTQCVDLQRGNPHSVVVYKVTKGTIEILQANHVIFATGGFSQIYDITSTSNICTGCGHRVLFQNNYNLKDIELVQFHPTGIKQNGLLISEACRSQGAYLLNTAGERFMEKYHHLKELAPRDIIAKAIHDESKKGDVYLDLRHVPSKVIRDKLISSYNVAKHFAGIDITTDLLPIAPTAHYNMGGISVDINYHAGEGVYAIGELACASVHGANRLGCNSLLELFTSAKAAAQNIQQTFRRTESICALDISQYTKKNTDISHNEIDLYRKNIKQEMQKNALIVKNEHDMLHALAMINNIYNKIMGLNNFSGIAFDESFISLFETQSLCLMAKCVLTSAIFRKHSIGAHFREDFINMPEKPQHTIVDNNFEIKYQDPA